MKKSPLAPDTIVELPEISGVILGTAATHMKYKNRDDLLLVLFPEGATVAGVLTKSKCSSAPVDQCKANLKSGKMAKALLVNAGNSNAFTGQAGIDAMTSNIDLVCKIASCVLDEVYVASTGVIGELLKAELINKKLEEGIKVEKDNWQQASDAILTTDTFPKLSTKQAKIGDKLVTINGFAKGSGMIAPDMATMLGFIFTDAALDQAVLQALLSSENDKSFNSITVDSDMSTSDTVLAFATGKNDKICDVRDPILDDFKEQLSDLMLDLSHQIVRDGEGATKFITIKVSGAENDGSAKKIAMSIANSPLVKTAIAGEDANWGRIVMAVGKAGERANRDALMITIGNQKVTDRGMRVNGYDEDLCTQHFQGNEIDIKVDVGVGEGEATVWTCDLTHDYISINADYRS